MTSLATPPATPAATPAVLPSFTTLPQHEAYLFICHGCNILLKDFTQHHYQIEGVGPIQCAGCELTKEDGYVMERNIKEYLIAHRNWTKKDMFAHFSGQAAASRRRQREIDDLH